MKYKNILVAVDFDHSDTDIIKHASDMALSLGATLNLVYVHPSSEYNAYTVAYWNDIYREFIASHEEKIDKKEINFIAEAYPILKENIFIKNGNITQQLLNVVELTQSELIILGKHHSIIHTSGAIESEMRAVENLDVLLVS
ncbi:hypothetical protein BCU70_09915 [Vibrio sp. 10N.286.49.C2]|uniref:universal stress protein n=1 Tax=unclassified Vibrio TaxID=2614977 RepID=UPI000C81CA73|nr:MULTISPECIES: universal stress protein [unclassified Vibrio]PMH26455.1 hypothetical protein BCU70_09915 [Vibrio sp. 10N.286.49.C2]PMH54821.1 hypothetical protein BCU66_11020 [Vibrio sp. 10N.286.49.B1]PMH80215.1 hypothetical protein BCU58_24070 [Vibrio sp. 10N.286.48.B7]